MRDLCIATSTVCALCLAFGMDAAAFGAGLDLKAHKPHFHWKTTAKGRQCIYDGAMLVAEFYGGSKKMLGIGRPISLHNLRLIPGGPIAIARGEACGPLCLSWRKHLIYYMRIDELEVNDEDPARFKLYVKSHDVGLRKDRAYQAAYEPNNVAEESWLELTYDPERPSYVFDVRTKMTVQPGREQRMISRDMRGLEFGDILPAQCNVPLDRKRFHVYVYKGRDGVYYKLPHDKHRGPEKRRILYARNGTLAFLLEPKHNPVIELVGDTGLNVFSEICHAMYDVHFKFSKDTELKLLKAGKPLEVHVRFYSISEKAGRRMLARSVWDPKLQLPSARRVPMAVGVVYGFESSAEGLHPTRCFRSKSAGSECAWDASRGYRSQASLSVARDAKDGKACWQAWIDTIHTAGLRSESRYRVRAVVRTENLSGRAELVWLRGKERRASRSLSGTQDWTPVDLDVGRQDGPAELRLVQHGAGRTWFDDVRLEPIP